MIPRGEKNSNPDEPRGVELTRIGQLGMTMTFAIGENGHHRGQIVVVLHPFQNEAEVTAVTFPPSSSDLGKALEDDSVTAAGAIAALYALPMRGGKPLGETWTVTSARRKKPNEGFAAIPWIALEGAGRAEIEAGRYRLLPPDEWPPTSEELEDYFSESD